MDREAFLTCVREAARVGNAYRVRTSPLPEGVGYCGAGDDPAARLVDEVNAVGGEGALVADAQAAKTALAELIERYSPTTALAWQHPLLDKIGLDDLLSGKKIEKLDYDELHDRQFDERRAGMLAADIGISSVSAAVAETGTLALASGPGRERIVSLLPPVHVALVGASQIVPDLFDLFAQMQPNDMPSNLVFITGPSKTGDLELKLTTGVHGPRHWHVIVIRDER